MSATEQADKGKAVAVDDQMPLGAAFSSACRVRACLLAPRGEGTVAESMAKRRQANRLARCICARSTTWSRSHTPAFCHCRSRRQQVMPDPQPISWGSFSQGMPVSRMKRMPRRACLSLRRGLPPLGFGGSLGRKGSMLVHRVSNSAGFIGASRPRSYPIFNGSARFC